MGGFEYVAVAWPARAPDPQPAMRRELEEAGFQLLGGCALTEDGLRAVGGTAASYGDEHGREFSRWAREPGQVFAAPDGSAYAQLAWLWECRYAMLTTVLADGRVIQTMTDWEADPAWPTKLAPHYDRTTDRHTEQQVLATDRSVQVVGGGAAAAWSIHRERLATFPGPLPDHSSLADFVEIYTAESRSRARWTRRVQIATFVLAFLAVLVPLVVITGELGEQPWWVDLAALAVAGAIFLVVHFSIWLRARRWRGLRPRFRAPVPGAVGTGITPS